MRLLPATTAELRARYAPMRTWATLSAVGLIVTLVRSALYDVPFIPMRSGMTPFIVMTLMGALYAAAALAWFAVRQLYVR